MQLSKYISPILESIRGKSIADDLNLAHIMALEYIKNVNQMRVFPDETAIDNLSVFDEPLGALPTETSEILSMLDRFGTPATVAQTGGRYFGFVNGGILPSALASKWLTDTWDQNPALFAMSPIASKIESVTEKWLVDLLGLPSDTVAGFVSGSSTATIIGLTTGRNLLLKKQGCDVIRNGLADAPKLKIVLSEGAHSTVYKALSIIGLGNETVIKVPMDHQGRIESNKIPQLDDRTLLILQAGNVNSGAFDSFREICTKAREAGAYVHIDGAFGLWAAACKHFEHLMDGYSLADSWSLDGHKTLNAPYDNGILLCRHKEDLINAMHMTGAYIALSDNRDGMLYTTEMSRRARAIDLWATLKGLGKEGVAELVWELHQKALYFSEQLKSCGLDVLNDVVFNQVLIRYKSDESTQALMKKVQNSGVCWFGGSVWFGKPVIRISVSSYKTTYEDIDLSVEAIRRCIKDVEGHD